MALWLVVRLEEIAGFRKIEIGMEFGVGKWRQ